MTLVSEIIRRGYREGNFIAIGTDPSTEESAEALAMLQGLVNTFFPLVVGTSPGLWYIPYPQRTASRAANYPALAGGGALHGDDQYPPSNVRLMMRNETSTTVYLQYQPQDGALMEYVNVGHTGDVILDANGALFGLTGTDRTLTITGGSSASRVPRKWVYRADYGAWMEIETLTLTADMPFPESFDDLFITELVMRLAPAYGNDPRNITLLRNREVKAYVRGLYVQSAEVWYNDAGGRSDQSYDLGYGTSDFNTGR